MCLITEQKVAKIAEQDIKVYKVLDTDRKSMFYFPISFKYEKDKLYKTAILDSDEWRNMDTIDRKYLDEKYGYNKWKWNDDLRCLGQGFHSIKNLDRAKDLSDMHSSLMFEATIPKGSEYYEDATGLIVSNQLIVH